MRSLHARLIVGLLGLLTPIALFAGAVAYSLDRNELDVSLDGQLRQIAGNVGDTDFPVSARLADGVTLDPEDIFVVAIWDHAGALHASDPSYVTTRPSRSGFANLQVAGESWRSYTRVDTDRTVQVAQRTVVRDEQAANSAVRAVLPFGVLVLLAWLVVGWAVSRALRPLDAVTAQLQKWGREGTNTLTLDGLPDEVLPLALATNELVTRLQAQVEFRERFISDAAHELRTPLAALQLQVRNLSADAGSPQYAELVAEVTSGIRRISEMVAKLLQLARADAATPRARVPVDLREAIATSLRQVLPMAAQKEIDIGIVSATAETVMAEPDELNTMIGNLIDNAVRYTPAHGTVDLAVGRAGSEVLLEVRDTGPGIPEQLLPQVFRRFVRVNGRDTGGSGLGLPIVQAIAERYGARVTLANRRDRSGLIARVIFSDQATSFGAG